MINRQKQSGMSMIGMMLVAILVVFVALVVMKMVPGYSEYFKLKVILKDIGAEAQDKNMTNADIRNRFAKRADVDLIESVTSSDLNIDRDSGTTIITLQYTYRVQLFANISLLADFSLNSNSRESKLAKQVE